MMNDSIFITVNKENSSELKFGLVELKMNLMCVYRNKYTMPEHKQNQCFRLRNVLKTQMLSAIGYIPARCFFLKKRL